jgi:putative FmdB family regulatory protein
MPTYEYRCGACGEEFEKFQRMSDEPGAPCPVCGEPAERRMSAGAGLLFKGSGFYITDYRSDSYKNAAKSESGGGEKRSDAGGESKGGTTKGDAGSAKKAEAAPAAKPPKKSE